jgi:hypothetical protein
VYGALNIQFAPFDQETQMTDRTVDGNCSTHRRVESASQNGTHSRAQVESFAIGGANVPRRFSIDIDEPLELGELGGGNAYANPQEYLLAASMPASS